jgi:hypothetical protein
MTSGSKPAHSILPATLVGEAQVSFEKDCLQVGRYNKMTFDSYRTDYGYSVDYLQSLFEGYGIAYLAKLNRLTASVVERSVERPESQTPTAFMTLVDAIYYGPDADDVIKAPEHFQFGYALINSHMWPKAVDIDTNAVDYDQTSAGAGSEYVDIVLIEGPGLTDEQRKASLRNFPDIDDFFHLKTKLFFEAQGRKHALTRIMVTHAAFVEWQTL